MKKTCLLIMLAVLTAAYSHAQNTFPATGNVGIGTTSPPFRLAVTDLNSSVQLRLQRTGTYAGLTDIGSDSNGFKIFSGGYDGNPEVIVKSDGNVGIGTTNPQFKLSVTALNSSVQLRLQRTGTYAGLTDIGSDSNGFKIFSGGYDGNPEVIVRSNGDVGIGTTDTKGYRLAVNGNAIFTGVKVKQYGAWPDYVFDANYALTPLADVETYIKAHKHLPDMTAADEVAKEGLDLGGNQGQLLKKIEELTLYMIQMNKKVEAIQHENVALKATKLNTQKQ